MVSLDSSFLIDLLLGKPAAIEKAADLDRRSEPRWISAPAASEVLLGGYYVGGPYLERTRVLIDGLLLHPFDRVAYHEAGRIGAELARRGVPLGQADLFIAAIAIRHGQSLVARDAAFSRVPGLRVEPY